MKKYLFLLIITTLYPQEIDLSLEWVTADSGFYTNELDSVVNEQISSLSNILGMIVIQKGKVLGEYYYNNSSVDDVFNIWSVTKSFTSTLIGQAIDQGFIIGEDSTLTHFLPDYGEEYIESVTLGNLLSMSSGYFDYSGYSSLNTEQLISISHGAPGSFWYSNAACHINSHVLYYGTDSTPYEFANTYLFPYLGIDDPDWYGGYLNINNASYDLILNLRDMVKLGQLYLQDGFSGNTQILSSDWIEKATSHKVYTGASLSEYGYLWWLPGRGYLAYGYGGQFIAVIPELELIIGTHSTDWGPGNINEHFYTLIDIIYNNLVPIFDRSPIFINEVLALNSHSYVDEQGEFEPYIEIYNCGTEPIDIGGYLVTNDIDNPESFYQIPMNNDSTIVEPGAFLLLWADAEEYEGILHLDFELNPLGGQIGLYYIDTANSIDLVDYPISANDLAYARTEECNDNWNYMDPTPNMSNTTQLNNNLISELPEEFTLFQNYPNPFNPVTTLGYDLLFDRYVTITIYDMQGRVVKELFNGQQRSGYRSIDWNATNNLGEVVSAGLYLYMVDVGGAKHIKKMALLK